MVRTGAKNLPAAGGLTPIQHKASDDIVTEILDNVSTWNTEHTP